MLPVEFLHLFKKKNASIYMMKAFLVNSGWCYRRPILAESLLWSWDRWVIHSPVIIPSSVPRTVSHLRNVLRALPSKESPFITTIKKHISEYLYHCF